MRRDKEYIYKLRQEGKTFREIEKETGVSRATLSDWFKGISWSKHISSENRKRNLTNSVERMERMNMMRKLKLQYQYALVESEAKKEYEIFKKDPLFWAGLMLYAGEGDKKNRHQIRLSNSDFYIHNIYILFAVEYLKIAKKDFKIWLLLYPELDETACRDKWAQELGLSNQNFYKTQIIEGKTVEKRLQYGVATSIISNTSLKKKILKWLSLAEKENFNTAGMVQG